MVGKMVYTMYTSCYTNLRLFIFLCRYTFDGETRNGKLNGYGKLIIGEDQTLQKDCLHVLPNILHTSEQPNVIEGLFADGILNGHANFTWGTLGYRVQALVHNGVIDGIFKAEQYGNLTTRKMIGYAEENEMSEKPAWLIDEDLVRMKQSNHLT